MNTSFRRHINSSDYLSHILKAAVIWFLTGVFFCLTVAHAAGQDVPAFKAGSSQEEVKSANPNAGVTDGTSFIQYDKNFNAIGDWYWESFTINSGSLSFVLRFASDFRADAAIVAADQLSNFTGNRSFTGYAVFDDSFGTKSVTLGPGTYYVAIRNQVSGANSLRLELDYQLTDVPGYKFNDVYMNEARTVAANGGLLWHGFTVQSGVKYFLDGANSGLETYVIPASQLDNFQNRRSFTYYTDYSGESTNLPGFYEITLPPGDYYLCFRNSNNIAKSVTYTMDRWVGSATPTPTPTPTPSGQANLTPYQPQGWSDKVVISKVTGTSTDSSPLLTTDTLYVDWAIINNGGAAISTAFQIKLYVDGVLSQTWTSPASLAQNFYTYVQDYSIGSLSAGQHTIRVVADTGGVIAETNEGDNEYTKIISVSTANPTPTPTPTPSASLQFNQAAYSVSEGAGKVAVTVNRTDASTAASVDYATTDTAGLTSCSVVNGIASSRCDYATTVGTLRFAAGESSKTISIPIVDDGYMDGTENFAIRLSNPAGVSLGANSIATITILDNDNSQTNPVVGVPYFVRQQYIDFLGREPDPGGFAAWQNILNSCNPGDTSCDRISVSSGFFRSPEFQDRGYFIYKFYSAALGRKPLYAEFMPDLAKVSGFLTDAQLEANKVAFVQEFMARTEYANRYGSLGNAAFVDTLIQTAGLQNHPSRNTWVDQLNNGSMTKAQVLRACTESAEVYQRFYNEAFVVMQYFGYLRRDPDILYQQWIQTMNSNGGNYRDMINGFMNAPEYYLRFGP